MLSPLACLPRDYRGFRISFTFLKTQHFATYVELHISGGASTVQVEAVVCTTLTAHSEPYNGGGIHASLLEPSANALHIGIGKSDVPRHPLSGDIGSVSHRQRQANVFGFCSGASPLCQSEKHEVLAARAGGCGRDGQPMRDANARWKRAVRFSAAM